MTIKLCKICSKEIIDPKRRILCSPECSKEKGRDRARQVAKEKQDRVKHLPENHWMDFSVKPPCPICNEHLPMPSYQGQVTCSKKCQRRRKQRREDAVNRLKPTWVAKERLSNRLREMLKRRGLQKTNVTMKYIGCTPKELVAWIESQWEKGMTWESYGVYGWHIDHVIPISRFDMTKEEHILVGMSWMNLRPLWRDHNLEKSNVVIDIMMPELRKMAEVIGVI